MVVCISLVSLYQPYPHYDTVRKDVCGFTALLGLVLGLPDELGLHSLRTSSLGRVESII